MYQITSDIFSKTPNYIFLRTFPKSDDFSYEVYLLFILDELQQLYGLE